MFEPKQGQIPGYTGHMKTSEEVDQRQGHKVPTKQIPGKLTNQALTSIGLQDMLDTFQESRVRMFLERLTERPVTNPLLEILT